MKTFQKIVLAVCALPALLVGYLYVGLFSLGACHRWRFDKDTLALEAVWRPWVTKIWKYGTTLGCGIIYHPHAIPENDTTEADTRHEKHEDVHVRQFQDSAVLALFVAILNAIFAATDVPALWVFVVNWLLGAAYMAPNFITALLRGGHVYRDAEHERSAYAQTDLTSPNGTESWLDDHLKQPRTW